MLVGSPEWQATLIDGAAQLGITVDDHQAECMALHGRELLAWNRRTNLTAIHDPLEVAVKHFIDSLAGLNVIPEDGRLLDIGSGGGFPGLPLKIMRPGQPMTLVDGVRKKISFLQHMIRTLPLSGIEALHVRAEAMTGNIGEDQGFDVVTCRALADEAVIHRLAFPLMAPDGVLVIYKGPQQDLYLSADDTYTSEFRVEQREYTLPFLGDARRLIVLRRRS